MNRFFPAIALVLMWASSSSAQTAYGDTPKFWEDHALVVANVTDVRHAEPVKDLIESVVTLTVQQSVPSRYAPGKEFSITFVRDLAFSPLRDRPTYAVNLSKGDRVMLIITEEKGQMVAALPQVNDHRLLNAIRAARPKKIPDFTKKPEPLNLPGYSSFAMLPGLQLQYPKEFDATVAETVKVCLAISEREPTRRLALIADILKTKPDARVTDLLRRNIQATLESSLRAAEEARRLLNEGKKQGQEKERAIHGTVRSFDGRKIVLDGNREIFVNAQTQYFQETGLDVMPVKSDDVKPLAAVLVAVKDVNGEAVATRVVLLRIGRSDMRSAIRQGPDGEQWSASGIVKEIKSEKIVLEGNKTVLVDAQAKYFSEMSSGGERELARLTPVKLADVKPGRTIDVYLHRNLGVGEGKQLPEPVATWVIMRPATRR